MKTHKHKSKQAPIPKQPEPFDKKKFETPPEHSPDDDNLTKKGKEYERKTHRRTDWH